MKQCNIAGCREIVPSMHANRLYLDHSSRWGVTQKSDACPPGAGDNPFSELDLQGFSTFLRRSVYLEALCMQHTGASAKPSLSLLSCNARSLCAKDETLSSDVYQ